MAGTIANIVGRFRSAWSVFAGEPSPDRKDVGPSIWGRQDRLRMTASGERSIMASVLTRIAVDVSELTFLHCRVDEAGYFKAPMVSGLN